MLIIYDYDLPEWAPPSTELGLSGQMLTLDGSIPVLGREETVCYLTGLGNGGKAHHIQLIRDNPNVKRWIIVVFSRDADAAALYRENILKMHADVRWVLWGEKAPEELSRILESDGFHCCLIYAKRPLDSLNEFSDHMKSLLPGMDFHIASGCPDMLRNNCSHLILAGSCEDDFLLELPDSLVQIPFFVLLRAQEAVQITLRPQELIQRISEHFRKSFRWNQINIAKRFYITNVLYEQWSTFCREHPENIPVLRNDPRLCVWDRYGLPLPVDEVSDHNILEFLERFTGCSALAAVLEPVQKG